MLLYMLQTHKKEGLRINAIIICLFFDHVKDVFVHFLYTYYAYYSVVKLFVLCAVESGTWCSNIIHFVSNDMMLRICL